MKSISSGMISAKLIADKFIVIYFRYPSYTARNYIAAIDYQHHLNLPQKVYQSGDAKGQPM